MDITDTDTFQVKGEPVVSGFIGFRRTLKENANLDDTLQNMKRIALRDAWQLKELAEELRGDTVAETAENIWDFIRANINYKLDTEGLEELRTPARTWHDRKIGVDCDDYTIFISAILLNLGIDHEYRVAAYNEKGKFEHIYPVAFDELGISYVIDNVPEIPQFNFEEQPIIDLKTVKMELQELSGTMGAVADSPEAEMQSDLLEELNEPLTLSGIEDDDDEILEANFLAGFGEVETEEEADIVLSGSEINEMLERGLLAEINKAKLSLLKERENPTVLSKTINLSKELQIIDDVMDAWDDEDERRDAMLDAIIQKSAYANFFKSILFSLDKIDEEGLSGFHEDEEIFLSRVDMNELLEDDEDEDVDGLGRRKRRRKKGRLKNFFKKIGKGIKKALKAVVRFNPVTITLRASILLVLKLNLLKMASKLIYGYLTEEQAKAQGLDLNEWRKIVTAKGKAERFFTKIGGKADKFKKAIVKGRAAKKTGLNLSGLGVATATATTAASGFILFVKKLLKKINPVRLFKNIAKKIKGKRAAKKAQAAMQDFTGDDSAASVDTGVDDTGAEQGGDETNTETDTGLEESGDGDGGSGGGGGGGTTKQGFMQRLKNIWAKHKGKFIIGSIVSVVVIVIAMMWNSVRKRRSLAGVKEARTKKRNQKHLLAGAKGKRLGKGSTTILKLPTSTIKKARVRKRSNTARLKEMHRIAKKLQKKHPKTKYSNLLAKASEQIKQGIN